MSSKKKKGGGVEVPLQADEVLKALVLADSFDAKFRPLTLDAPRALLPVANIPLLEYTLEFLAAEGIDEILVFCCAHAKAVQQYLEQSRWKHVPGVSVSVVISTTSLSAGDALREMESKGLLTSDFLLVSGDVVANMKLSAVLAAHKARRKKDKNCIMTTVFKKAEPSHRTRSMQDDIVVAIERSSGKLLYFDNDPESKTLDIDQELFGTQAEVQVRCDLIDCRIDICAPEVLLLFADNFDYQDVRQDFIRGILTAEILGNKIHAHVISGEYAARVKCLRTYDSVTKDIMHRWCYPFVPETNFVDTTFTYTRGPCYIEKNVKLSRSCSIADETLFGSGTVVGENSKISHSTIGRNCIIGANVKISGSYIWDNVIIEDNVVIQQSLISSGVKLKKDCKIQAGCLVSYNVVVGSGVTIPPQSKLLTKEAADRIDEDSTIKEIDNGTEGHALVWVEEEDLTNTINGRDLELTQKVQDLSDEETDSENEDEADEVDDKTEQEKFQREAADIIHSSVLENHNVDPVVLEINALKFAYDSNFIDCAVIILNTLLDEGKSTDSEKLLPEIKKILEKWSPLLAKFVTNEDEQVEIIWGLQEYCEKPGREKCKSLFPFLLHTLYDAEIVEEEAVWKWVEEHQGGDRAFVQLSQNFLNWLKEAEQEDSEESDDE